MTTDTAFIFATHNTHKLREVNAIIGTRFRLLSLSDVGFYDEIPEPHDTLEANALEKARVVHRRYPHANIIAEDTGLEVAILYGAPGVVTARYAGNSATADDNMRLLLQNMAGASNRQAQFRTILTLILHQHTYLFEGIALGTIRTDLSGMGGFGYDPIFEPLGYQQTYAEMPDKLKNSISHRHKAVEQLATFLHSHL